MLMVHHKPTPNEKYGQYKCQCVGVAVGKIAHPYAIRVSWLNYCFCIAHLLRKPGLHSDGMHLIALAFV